MPPRPKPTGMLPYWNAQRRTCLVVRRMGTTVLHVPLLTAQPLRIIATREPAFDTLWKPIPDYPVKVAAQLLLRYTQDLGAEKDVMEALATVIKVSSVQREQAAAVLAKVKQPAPKTKVKGAY